MASSEAPPSYPGAVLSLGLWPEIVRPTPGRLAQAEAPPPGPGAVLCSQAWRPFEQFRKTDWRLICAEEAPPYPGMVLSSQLWLHLIPRVAPCPYRPGRAEATILRPGRNDAVNPCQ